MLSCLLILRSRLFLAYTEQLLQGAVGSAPHVQIVIAATSVWEYFHPRSFYAFRVVLVHLQHLVPQV